MVRGLAHAAGFDETRIAAASPPAVLSRFAKWVEEGHAGIMDYLTDQADRRSDLTVAFPWAKTVIVSALQYDTPHPYSTDSPGDAAWIARYAWGDDYHDVVRKRLEALRASLGREIGAFESRAYVDTGPVAEKAYAVAAGLGSYGKNTCVLNQTLGSWFFIGVLITDLDLAPDLPTTDICGTCRACLDACPTQAFPGPYVLDARRCISYLTIEVKDVIDPELRGAMGRHVFGCDICQDVCPWNRKPPSANVPEFRPAPGMNPVSLEEALTITDAEFRQRFRGTPLFRIKRHRFVRNALIATVNQKCRELLPAVRRLAEDENELIRTTAQWALRRL